MSMKLLAGAAALATATWFAAPAAASTLPTTVSASRTYFGDLAVLTDGVYPADGSFYFTPETVAFGPGLAPSPGAQFTFDFGGAVDLASIAMSVDNNDDYLVQFFNGTDEVGAVFVLADEGNVPWGMETFTRGLALGGKVPSAVLTASVGDFLYSVGEVQFDGTPAPTAVPEPASWAMMIAGFGLIGGALRRRVVASLAFARA